MMTREDFHAQAQDLSEALRSLNYSEELSLLKWMLQTSEHGQFLVHPVVVRHGAFEATSEEASHALAVGINTCGYGGRSCHCGNCIPVETGEK